MILNFFLILVLAALNGFFVAAEFAVLTARKRPLRRQSEDGNQAAHAASSAGITQLCLLVPESSTVRALIGQFQSQRRQIAIALDEYAGAAGLITLNDALEGIVGEISDSFDDQLPGIQRINKETVLVDGLIAMEEVNQALGTEFDDPNYDTIAGYILGHLDHIPSPGETILLSNGIQLQVVSMDGLRISQVKIRGV